MDNEKERIQGRLSEEEERMDLIRIISTDATMKIDKLKKIRQFINTL